MVYHTQLFKLSKKKTNLFESCYQLILSIQCNCEYINFMSKQFQTERRRSTGVRPFSATLHRQRPSSGQVSQRQDQVQHTYSPAQPRARLDTATTLIRQLSTNNDNNDKPKKLKTKKQQYNEGMEEEILHLKLKVNGLTKELDHQRGKTEEMRKKNQRFSKVLNVEFQNERLWNAKIVDSHRVEGIRNMYDKLKEEYEKLKKSQDQLLQSQKNTKQLQYLQYISVLETELKAVNQRFQKITKNSLQLLSHENNYESQARLFLLQETEHEYEQLLERYNKLKARKQMLTQNLDDRNRRIEFMERYSKDLQNRVRDLERKNDKSLKENNKLKEELHLINHLIETNRNSSEKEIEQLKRQLIEVLQKSESQKKALVQEKDEKINHLFKENQYYQEMIKELRATNNQLSEEMQIMQRNHHHTKTMSKVAEGFSHIIKQQQTEHKQIQEFGGAIAELGKKSQKREMKVASQKYNEEAPKKVKVNYYQVQEINQLLKLKMIGLNIPFERVLSLLSYKKNPSLSEADNNWNEQYISMKEVKQILKKDPFQLDEDGSTLLSRYIIEDSKLQFVYVDEINQNYRIKVKSIFKTILGEYPLLTNNQFLTQELMIFLQRYGVNLCSMLKTMQPSGLISQKRFKDTLRSIGAEYSDDLVDIILGKMAIKAKSLKELNFKIVFGQFEK